MSLLFSVIAPGDHKVTKERNIHKLEVYRMYHEMRVLKKCTEKRVLFLGKNTHWCISSDSDAAKFTMQIELQMLIITAVIHENDRQPWHLQQHDTVHQRGF